jgi:D-alanine--poly(phosphoribitol) ligase subunit 2
MDAAQEATVIALLAYACGTDEIAAERDLDLFDAGLLDSMAFTEVLVGLDDELGVRIAPTEVDRDEVATVNRLLRFVSERL